MSLLRFFTLVSIIVLLKGSILYGQLKTGYKALKKGDYGQAVVAFEADLLNSKEEIAVEAEHNLSKIYLDKKYSDFNLEKAYEYAKSALKRHEHLALKEQDKLQKRGVGFLTIKSFKQQVVEEAYRQAVKEKTYSAYQHFLDFFDSNNPIHKEEVSKMRNEQGFRDAEKLNTCSAYEQFYQKHHESCSLLSPNIYISLQKQLFEACMRERSWSSFGNFSGQYPNNIFIQDSLATQSYLPIARSQNMDDFKRFLIGFPNSPYAKLAIDNICILTIQKNKIEDYDYFVRSFAQHPQVNEIWAPYYRLFITIQGANAESEFKKLYPHAPIDKLKKMYK